MTCNCTSANELEFNFELVPELEIIGGDTRLPVGNTKVAPYRYICNIVYQNRSRGTGTLIGPSTVLTAGHCVAGRAKQDMRIVPGRNGASEPFGSSLVLCTELFPGYAPTTRTDIGIIHLSKPLGNTAGYWTRPYTKRPYDPMGTSILAGNLPLPVPVNVCGYPRDSPATAALNCRVPNKPTCAPTALTDPKRHASCGTFPYRSHDTATALKNGLLYYANDTCVGQSGSPVWVDRGAGKGGRCLTAVHVGYSPSAKANIAVLLDKDVMKFVIANTR